MAPSLQPVTALQGSHKRPTKIVPAIPLPYIQKRGHPITVVRDRDPNGRLQTASLPSSNGTAAQQDEASDKKKGTLRIETSQREETQERVVATNELSETGKSIS